MRRRAGVGLMLGRHRKRLANIISTLGQCFCLLALSSGNNCTIILIMFSLYIRASMITLFNYHFCVT